MTNNPEAMSNEDLLNKYWAIAAAYGDSGTELPGDAVYRVELSARLREWEAAKKRLTEASSFADVLWKQRAIAQGILAAMLAARERKDTE